MISGILLTRHKNSALNLINIESVESILPISDSYGTSFTNLNLPTEVEVTLVGGATENRPIQWKQGSYNPLLAGTYDIFGEIQLRAGISNTLDIEAEIEVTITGDAENLPIALSGTTETFTAETPDFFGTDDRRFNGPIEPGMVYDTDTRETIMTMARPWNATYKAYAGLWKYSSLYGAYPAFIDIGEPQDADNHLTPGIFKGTAGYHVLQENTHIGNIDRFLVSHDFSSSVKQTVKTGTFSRMGIRRTGANTCNILHQNGTTDMAYTPFDGTTYGTTVVILTHATKRIYAFAPYGPEEDSSGWVYIPFAFTEGTPGAAFPAKGLLKTQDWLTFYNIDESQSFNVSGGPESLANLANPALKWLYIGDYNDVSALVNLNGAISSINVGGSFHDITVYPGSGEITTTFFSGGAWQQNVFEPALPIAGFPETGLADSNATCWCTFKRGATLYAMIRVTEATFHKFHLFATTNDGVSWTDLGDMTPGVNVNIYRAVLPLNLHEVPENENFPIGTSKFAYVGGPAAFGDIYIQKAAFGEIQLPQSYIYTNKYNHITEFPSLHVAYESDDVTISSGTTISQLNDKVGSRPAIAIGSPQLTSGEIVCNGTSSAFEINNYVGEFNTHTVRTIIFVGRSAGYIFSISKTTDDNMFDLERLSTTKFSGSYRFGSSGNTIAANGVGSDISGVKHIYVAKRDGRSWRWFIDGIEQNKTFSIAGSGFDLYGRCSGLTTPNRVGIGVLQRAANTFQPLIFSAFAYATTSYTVEQRMQAENFLADKYGITITR